MGQVVTRAVGAVWAADADGEPADPDETHASPNVDTTESKPVALAPNEVDWPSVATAVRQKNLASAIQALSVEPLLRKQLEDPHSGLTEHDRLVHVISNRYFDAVRSHSYQPAARFAVLYSQLGCDTFTAIEFLKQQTLSSLEKLHATSVTALRASGIATEVTAEEITVPLAMSRLFDFANKVVQHHAYADQAFSPHCTLALVRNLQPLVEQAAVEYLNIFDSLWKLDRLEMELQRGRPLDHLLQDRSLELTDLLEEFASLSQQVEVYKWYLRHLYEQLINTLKERGWTFVNEPGLPDRLAQKELNILLYIYEPQKCYSKCSLLSRYQILFERYYLIRSLELQFSSQVSDSPDASDTSSDVISSPHVSSQVDTAFVVLQRVAERSLISRNVAVFEHVFKDLLDQAINSTLFEILGQRVRSSLPSATAAVLARTKAGGVSALLKNTFGRVSVPSPSLQSLTQHITIPYNSINLALLCQSLNDLVAACTYISKLVAALDKRRGAPFKTDTEEESNRLVAAWAHWTEVASRNPDLFVRRVLSSASDLLQWNSLIKQHISVMKDHPYDSGVATESTWPASLVGSVKELVWSPINTRLTEDCAKTVLHFLINSVCSMVEECILEKRFSMLGALQLDADIRKLFLQFSELSPSSIRSNFARLRQIGSIMSLESLSEVLECWNLEEDATLAAVVPEEELGAERPKAAPIDVFKQSNPKSKWKISVTEAKQFLKRRMEFSPAAVDKLKLNILHIHGGTE